LRQPFIWRVDSTLGMSLTVSTLSYCYCGTLLAFIICEVFSFCYCSPSTFLSLRAPFFLLSLRSPFSFLSFRALSLSHHCEGLFFSPVAISLLGFPHSRSCGSQVSSLRACGAGVAISLLGLPIHFARL